MAANTLVVAEVPMHMSTCKNKKIAEAYCAKCFSPIKEAMDSDSRQFFSNDLSCRCLAELDEARGLLESVSCRDGLTVAAFSWGSVALPPELEPKLRELVGRKTAVLRLDGRYHCRAVD